MAAVSSMFHTNSFENQPNKMLRSTILPSLFLTLILSTSPATALRPAKTFHARALVLSVYKDPSTSQYVANVLQRTPLKTVPVTLDIGGKSLWVACDRKEYNSSTYTHAPCKSPQCKLAKSNKCGNCWDGPNPGCNDNTCSNVVYDTIGGAAQIGELATDVLAVKSTDGRNPGRIVEVKNFLFSCGSLFLGENLAKGVKGIAGFGRSEISLPSLLSSALGIRKKFAICLSSSKGVIFIGDGPYAMLPNVIISDRLVYTPLEVNPVNTAKPIIDSFPDKSWPSMEYFIGVQSIRVNGRTVPISPNLLKIDTKGRGGTSISTVAPYTVLHTSIYSAITKAFAGAISRVPRANPVSPFSTCYKASSLGSTRLGPGVPPIELVLGNNVTWTIFGANSMVLVSNDVICLAFVDGGKKPRTSIVIGGHQLEDNLLEFDVVGSRMGLSSTLLGRQTTCSNFNFTSAE